MMWIYLINESHWMKIIKVSFGILKNIEKGERSARVSLLA